MFSAKYFDIIFATGAHLDLEAMATIDLILVSVGIESILSYFKIAIARPQLKCRSARTARIWHVGERFSMSSLVLECAQLCDATVHL